jgi:type II secretory pathway component GspD/PulD (secretin)
MNAQESASNPPVSLNHDNVDVRASLKILFTSVGANYSIDPDVQGFITVHLTCPAGNPLPLGGG